MVVIQVMVVGDGRKHLAVLLTLRSDQAQHEVEVNGTPLF